MSSLRSSDPIWWRNKRIKEGQFSPALQPFLFTVDITHMGCKCPVNWQSKYIHETVWTTGQTRFVQVDYQAWGRGRDSWMALLLEILDVGGLCILFMSETPSCCHNERLPILTRLATVLSWNFATLPKFEAVNFKCRCCNQILSSDCCLAWDSMWAASSVQITASRL